ncbi:MAG TPA: RNA polymerase sigma factor [Patescibacteria group bacterium]|nr:RNA polymerase sigma factor [Patescibacteria group bacterium]
MSADDNKPGDGEIIQRILDGEANAYELLLARYHDYVFGVVMNHVPKNAAGEVAHDAFVRAYLSLPMHKRTDRFRYWLSRITVRTCHDYWRKRYRSREQPFSTLDGAQKNWLEEFGTGKDRSSYNEEVSRHEAREVLEWAMDRLSPGDRMVLELIHIEERPVREAADMLGWSVANVKIRAFRSRKKLRKLLEKTLSERGGTR